MHYFLPMISNLQDRQTVAKPRYKTKNLYLYGNNMKLFIYPLLFLTALFFLSACEKYETENQTIQFNNNTAPRTERITITLSNNLHEKLTTEDLLELEVTSEHETADFADGMTIDKSSVNNNLILVSEKETDEAYLMAMVTPGEDDVEISLESTAVAFVCISALVFSCTDDNSEQIMDAIRSTPSFPTLIDGMRLIFKFGGNPTDVAINYRLRQDFTKVTEETQEILLQLNKEAAKSAVFFEPLNSEQNASLEATKNVAIGNDNGLEVTIDGDLISVDSKRALFYNINPKINDLPTGAVNLVNAREALLSTDIDLWPPKITFETSKLSEFTKPGLLLNGTNDFELEFRSGFTNFSSFEDGSVSIANITKGAGLALELLSFGVNLNAEKITQFTQNNATVEKFVQRVTNVVQNIDAQKKKVEAVELSTVILNLAMQNAIDFLGKSPNNEELVAVLSQLNTGLVVTRSVLDSLPLKELSTKDTLDPVEKLFTGFKDIFDNDDTSNSDKLKTLYAYFEDQISLEVKSFEADVSLLKLLAFNQTTNSAESQSALIASLKIFNHAFIVLTDERDGESIIQALGSFAVNDLIGAKVEDILFKVAKLAGGSFVTGAAIGNKFVPFAYDVVVAPREIVVHVESDNPLFTGPITLGLVASVDGVDVSGQFNEGIQLSSGQCLDVVSNFIFPDHAENASKSEQDQITKVKQYGATLRHETSSTNAYYWLDSLTLEVDRQDTLFADDRTFFLNSRQEKRFSDTFRINSNAVNAHEVLELNASRLSSRFLSEKIENGCCEAEDTDIQAAINDNNESAFSLCADDLLARNIFNGELIFAASSDFSSTGDLFKFPITVNDSNALPSVKTNFTKTSPDTYVLDYQLIGPKHIQTNEFVLRILWGDGSNSEETLNSKNFRFQELFTHTYENPGVFEPRYRICNATVTNCESFDLETAFYFDSTEELTNADLDVAFIVDLSGSYDDDLIVFQEKSTALAQALQEFSTGDIAYAVTSFIDYPIAPFGSNGDFEYRLESDFSPLLSTFQTSLESLSVGSGADFRESQLTALKRTADELSWRTDSLKIVLLATDADFHDSANESDYPGPSFDEALDSLAAIDIRVLGLSSGGVVSDLQRVANETGGALFSLDNSSSQLIEELLNYLSQETGSSSEAFVSEKNSTNTSLPVVPSQANP